MADKSTSRPSNGEPFMNQSQRQYFRTKLVSWRDDILVEVKETLERLQGNNEHHPDLADHANSEADRAVNLRAHDRQRKLIAKIDAALQRIEDGTYGYCARTGEPIGLKRLEARPIATLSVEAQEWHERQESSIEAALNLTPRSCANSLRISVFRLAHIERRHSTGKPVNEQDGEPSHAKLHNWGRSDDIERSGIGAGLYDIPILQPMVPSVP